MGYLAAAPERNVITGAFESVQEKTQGIRALDVGAVGPLMILAAVVGLTSRTARFALAFAGAATITFNGRNLVNSDRQ